MALESKSKGLLCCASQGPWGCQDAEWFVSPHQGAMEWRWLHGSLADFPPTCVVNGVSEHLLTAARNVEEAVKKPRRCLGNADTDAVTRPQGKMQYRGPGVTLNFLEAPAGQSHHPQTRN